MCWRLLGNEVEYESSEPICRTAFFSCKKDLHYIDYSIICFSGFIVLFFYDPSLPQSKLCIVNEDEDFQKNKEWISSVVQQSGQYINDFDIYTSVERTMNKNGILKEKGKLIVFQMCAENDCQRLIVYDESDEMAYDKGNHRYIGESCAAAPGDWKYGDPTLCATHPDGSIFILSHYEVRVKHMESHFYTVWVKNYLP